jgi:3-oxoacyl-[acyl-carrier-protein] synthase-1
MIKQHEERVVVTGYGCLTSVGHNFTDTWAAITQGQSGISRITQWDVTGWEHPLGAEIKNYDPKTLIADRKLLKLLSRHDVIGLNAVAQALAHSQLLPYRESLADATFFNDRSGVFVGSPGSYFRQQYDFHPLLNYAQGDMQRFAAGLFEQVHPMWLLRILPNNVLAYTGIQYQFKGANENVANHAVSSMQAIAEACHALKQGTIDRAIAVGYESAVEPQGQIYYGSLGALSSTGLQSFDQERSGTVLAEGAGALVLETLSAAKERGAVIYGEILAAATTNEAMGVFPVREDADGLIRALNNVLIKAKLQPDAIGMLTAHGNGTYNSDTTEAIAINTVFSPNSIPTTGFKWSLGHTLTAAGVLETILTLQCLRQQQLPGIASLKTLARDCAGLRVSNNPQAVRSPIGVVVSRGFASVNCCLVIRAG